MNAEELKDCAFLIFNNKQDLSMAIDANQMIEKLGLEERSDKKWHIQNSIALTCEGIYEGLDWMSNAV